MSTFDSFINSSDTWGLDIYPSSQLENLEKMKMNKCRLSKIDVTPCVQGQYGVDGATRM